jgi:hypothetical protein
MSRNQETRIIKGGGRISKRRRNEKKRKIKGVKAGKEII